VIKKFIERYQKSISAVLLTLAFVGSLAAILAVLTPFFGLAVLSFIDNRSQPQTVTEYILKVFISALPAVPFALIVGGLAAWMCTFVDSHFNKIFLRVYGTILLIVVAVYMYMFSH
jgi:hypothetical protein